MASIQAEIDRRSNSQPNMEERITQLKYRLDTAMSSGARMKTQLNAVERENSELEHIAYNALDALVKQGGAEFLMLKDETIRNWWSKYKNE
jgi:di/tripeptidase